MLHHVFIAGRLKYFISSLDCNKSLGLENGNIRNIQMSASISGAGTVPTDARYNNGSGWCVRGISTAISSFKDNYHLQIDLLDVFRITGILLQGAKDAKYRDFSYGSHIKIQYGFLAGDAFNTSMYKASMLQLKDYFLIVFVQLYS